MIKNSIVLSALLLSFLATNHSLANDDSTLGVLLKSRHDIDYHLNTYAVSVSLITPAGLFRCDPGALAGKTRIDSFNNIIGISDVRNAQWNSFSAHDLECRYGAKWNAVEGAFKAGIGFRDYQGNTDDKPGGKDISIEGAGALLDYESEIFDTKLEWKREIHDYTLMHQTSVGNYNSLIDATKNTYTLSSTYGKLYIHAKHLRGNKDNVYTTPLFPTNRFRYGYTDLAIGMNLMPEADGLTLFAPIIGNGTYLGSFNPLTGDSGLKGVQLAGRVKGFELDFHMVRHKGEGSRPYLPATEQLTENKDATTISMGIKKGGWTARLEHSKSVHTANAAIAHPTYAAIVGGYGPFNNKRGEEKWTLSASFPLLKKLTADLSLYHTARHDRQFTHPEHNYTEKGGFILLRFRK